MKCILTAFEVLESRYAKQNKFLAETIFNKDLLMLTLVRDIRIRRERAKEEKRSIFWARETYLTFYFFLYL